MKFSHFWLAYLKKNSVGTESEYWTARVSLSPLCISHTIFACIFHWNRVCLQGVCIAHQRSIQFTRGGCVSKSNESRSINQFRTCNRRRWKFNATCPVWCEAMLGLGYVNCVEKGSAKGWIGTQPVHNWSTMKANSMWKVFVIICVVD